MTMMVMVKTEITFFIYSEAECIAAQGQITRYAE
jgi:hypothetical protein